ncbi:MAG: hypothetical protein IJF20_07355 [Clostridia bacterium]|nr:hypothetical protein [Oscillospiraceae bacterium]MBQ2829048.1 hypothetical protein [Clostridia bacterium]
MNKIISWILSIVMLVLSFFGIGAGNTADMTKGEWLDKMCATLGYETEDAVQLCLDLKIIDADDVNDVDEAADTAFVFGTLKNAATVLGVDYAKVTAEAIKQGILNAKGELEADAKDAADAYYSILGILKDLADDKEVADKAAEIIYEENVVEIETADYSVNGNVVTLPAGTALAAGDVFTVPQVSGNLEGGIYEAVSVKETANGVVVETEEADLEDVVESIDYAAAFSPNMAAAQVVSGDGELIQAGVANNEGIKETIDEVKNVLTDKEALKGAIKDLLVDTLSEGSFDVGDASVDYAFTDGGFDIAISGDVGEGINIRKSYSVSNLELLTKFDGTFKNGKPDVKEGYLKLNYDCVDTTKVSASYSASLVSGVTEDISSMEIVDQIKMNFENLKLEKGTARFPVFTAHIAIPNCGPLTIKLEASVVFNIYGYAELILTTENCVGYEIIDNNGRFIYESTETAPKVFNAMGTAEALVGLNCGLTIFGIQLIDVGLQGGLGVYVYATVTLPYADFTTTSIDDIPANLLAQSVAILDNADQITVSGTAQFYGIFRISLCEESITSKIGLSETWTIVDRTTNNGTFATINF